VTVKTSLDVAGSPTTCGVPARAAHVPEAAGPQAEGLLRAGAVVVARGNAPDFSLRLHTDNELHGPTRNPWDPGRTPGGSGGGEAVAVATGMACLGLGGDVGGSLRIPAQWNGVATLKATPGRIPSADSGEPAAPTLGLQLMTSYGPFARCVADLRLGYEALARDDPRDPWSLPFPPGAGRGEPGAGTRVAVLAAGELDGHVRAGLERAAAALAGAGYVLERDAPPGLDAVSDLWARLFLTDVRARWDTLGPLLGADARRWLSDAFTARPPLGSSGELLAAYAERHTLAAAWRRFQTRVPLLLAPVMAVPAPPVGFDLRGPAAIAELLRHGRFVFAVNVLGLPAAVVPVGVAHGVPQAVQLIGPPYGEASCLAAAEAVERAAGTLTPIDPR
jgi:amidase